MTTKRMGFYDDNLAAEGAGNRLVLDVSNQAVACLACGDGKVYGVELFSVEDGEADWENILRSVKNGSRLLDRHYDEVDVYHHSEEALVIPVKKFDTVAAKDYLALVFGERREEAIHHDVLAKKMEVVAYYPAAAIQEVILKQFPEARTHHLYTAMLDDLLTRAEIPQYLVQLQAFEGHFVLSLVKDNKLQLIRSFDYTSAEDILYYLASILQQFPVIRSAAHLELGGRTDEHFPDHGRLRKLFGEISHQPLRLQQQPFRNELSALPSHYFTPLFNLAI